MQGIPTTAIILAGGYGTRLRPILVDRPKVLAPIADRPFLDYLLAYLAGQGIRQVGLALGYLAEQVQEFVKDGRRWKLLIECAVEPQPLGTGGALKFVFDRLRLLGWLQSSESLPDLSASHLPFFVLNGDTLFNIDLAALWNCHWMNSEKARIKNRIPPWATIALRSLDTSLNDQKERGCVRFSEDGLITVFDEKPDYLTSDTNQTAQKGSIAANNWINAGVYLMTSQVIESISPNKSFSLERQIFPSLVQGSLLAGCPMCGYFADIGTPASLVQFEQDVSSGVIR